MIATGRNVSSSITVLTRFVKPCWWPQALDQKVLRAWILHTQNDLDAMILMRCLSVKAELNPQIFMANYWSGWYIFLSRLKLFSLSIAGFCPPSIKHVWCVDTHAGISLYCSLADYLRSIKWSSQQSLLCQDRGMFSPTLMQKSEQEETYQVAIPHASYIDVNTMLVWCIGMSKHYSMTIVGKRGWSHHLSHTKSCVHHTNLALWLLGADHLTCKQEWKIIVIYSFLV